MAKLAKQTRQPNSWIDRYVAEVGRMLPAAQRADVEMEMRSLIEEEAEARSSLGGDPVDSSAKDEVVLEVLRAFGRPQEVAARYGAQQYLIGPALYPTFMTVLRIVLAVMVGVNLLGLALAIGVDQTQPGIAETLAGLLSSLVQGGGMVVLVFALIERLNRAALEKALAAGEWDPRSLPEVEDRTRVKVGETVTGIAFTVVALLVLNFYLDRLGFSYVQGEGVQRFALFSPAFRRYVPLLTVWWGLDLVLNVVLLARGRWVAWLRWADLAIQGIGVAVLLRMLTGPALAAWEPVEPAFRVTLGIMLVATLFDAGRHIYTLLMQRGERGSATPTLTVA